MCPNVGSVVEWFKCLDCNRHGLGLKPTRAILLCLWISHSVVSLHKKLYGTFPCLVVLASSFKLSRISIKFEADSNILASPKAGWGHCLPYALAPPSLSCESGG